jgi:NAD(P)-dependent dehydrogenase (short-subunit alcohol dehydrogenase family)
VQVKDKIIIVTGAANGIGEALARRFYAGAARAVVVVDREAEKATAVAAGLGGHAYGVDVADEAQVCQMIRDVERKIGPVDLYCSNAGVGFSDAPGWTSAGAPNENWEASWQVNVMAHVYAARALLPGMIARKSGTFLIVASAAGLLSQIGDAAYSTTKHAAIGFAESLAITHGDDGIKVSVLCPQGVKTRMLDNIDPSSVASDGLLEPSEVAECAVKGLMEQSFLILPHESVKNYMNNKVNDYDRWLGGMRKFRRLLMAGKDTPI